ncbi:MAG: sensor histidine kinase [Anaerolineae bacterium]|nr:sensor histidine kinase [Anaerolineae bacterium]
MLSAPGYVVLLAVGATGVISLPEGKETWPAYLLLVVMGLLLVRIPSLESPAWWQHLYLAVQTCAAVGLILMNFEGGVFQILFFMLSAQAMIFLPLGTGLGWVAAFSVITGGLAMALSGVSLGVLSFLVYGAGYMFFAVFGYNMRQAESERQKSQALLDELQQAHSQLQAYITQAEELAVAEERNRMAREMHDAIGHRLTVAAVQLEGAQRLIPDEPDRAGQMIATVREQVREALGELRQTVTTLRQPLHTGLSLPQALKKLVETFEKGTHLQVNTLLEEDLPEVPPNQRLAIYRAAQEALTNIQRHAQASQVWLQLVHQENQLTLLVRDNGNGFPQEASGQGFGLRGMQERAAQLGGEFHMETVPKGGAQIKFSIPFDGEQQDG